MKELSLPSIKCFLPYGASWKLRLIVHCILNTCIYCITCITPGVSVTSSGNMSKSIYSEMSEQSVTTPQQQIYLHPSSPLPVSLPPPHLLSLITIFSSSKNSYVSPSSPFPPHRIFSGLSCINTQSRCLSPAVITGSLAALLLDQFHHRDFYSQWILKTKLSIYHSN